MKRLSLILSFLFAVSFTCAAQSNNDSTITISGRVVDKNNEPLINAAIQLLDSNSVIVQQTITDYDGNYLIQNVNIDNKYSLAVRYLGMKTSMVININTTNDEILNFKMEPQENIRKCVIEVKTMTIHMIDTYDYSPLNKTITSDQIEKLAH